ncbi:plasmid pRiA4b ORF-3 family protein [Tessaracoccus caeni]|uniref:plasmid pRiA4b ORF-3 family protein n=1 Tax=Tessaracoccus caeni TaxID=3031239 RepID=UPI0023DA01E9|nr:plasmid pRiA4b ORF-3 family protein [Tessaracoccus caeni]MDF1489868.1 plasmid pRiA4b ORF-3 family protein [Tessaracoccus caeni]
MSNEDNVIPFPGIQTPSGGRAGFSPPDLASFLDSIDFSAFRPEMPKLLRKRSKKVAYVARLDLDDTKPPIWRRLRLASDLTLDALHDIIQLAMGWQDCHLHHFVMGPDTRDIRRPHFLAPFDVEEGDEGIAESEVRLDQVLSKPGHRLFYEYDFGDGWWHTIKLEKVEPWVDGDPDAHCLAGRRACPPEDLGGVGMVGALNDWLAGNTEGYDQEWVEQVLGWLPPGYDPVAFSVDEVNEALAAGPLPEFSDLPPLLMQLVVRAGPFAGTRLLNLVKDVAFDEPLPSADADAAVRPYRFLLDLLRDGLTLTKAGYLPPRVVEALWAGLDFDDEWIGKGNREDMTLPVLELRESATALGLLRKARGQLTLTANGRKLVDAPSSEILAYIASRLPLGKDHQKDAGALLLLFAAAGRDWFRSSGEAGELMAEIGWALRDGSALNRAVLEWARPTDTVLDRLCGRRSGPETRAAVARELLRLAQ